VIGRLDVGRVLRAEASGVHRAVEHLVPSEIEARRVQEAQDAMVAPGGGGPDRPDAVGACGRLERVHQLVPDAAASLVLADADRLEPQRRLGEAELAGEPPGEHVARELAAVVHAELDVERRLDLGRPQPALEVGAAGAPEVAGVDRDDRLEVVGREAPGLHGSVGRRCSECHVHLLVRARTQSPRYARLTASFAASSAPAPASTIRPVSST
jgi:hypothetical protein